MNTYIYIAMLLGVLLTVGCSKRIGFDQPVPVSTDLNVQIAPDWGTMPKPSSLKAVFYTYDDALYGEYNLPVEGGVVTLPKNKYRMLLFNADAESVLFNHMDIFGNATAAIGSTKASMTDIPCPGMLFSIMSEISEENTSVAAAMIPRSNRVTIKIELTGNETISNVRASLHNIADAINLATGMPYHSNVESENRSILTNKSTEGNMRIFEGMAFGCCMEEFCGSPSADQVYVDIAIDFPDGTQMTVTADITEAMKEVQQNITEISIEVLVEDLGLTATVTGWTTGTASGDIKL